MAETVGQRLYLIRLACGDGVRKAEPMKAFVARVKRVTKQHYDPMTISLLERMKQGWTLDDVERMAAVDPLGRTPAWLAGWEKLDQPTRIDAPKIGKVAPDPRSKLRGPTAGRKEA